ncbi:hypothetical protein AB0950_05300 [Streptomyces sp. NPDC007189]|uniref:hypothetical protein n=1 Tax=Streptomyces sp. NPDC007189 TaxID=3154315 RepID=UPI003452DD34
MTKLVSLPSGDSGEHLAWFATAALFDDVAAFVLGHVADEQARRAVIAGAASGHVFVGDLPEPDQTAVLLALRSAPAWPTAHANQTVSPPSGAAVTSVTSSLISSMSVRCSLAARGQERQGA